MCAVDNEEFSHPSMSICVEISKLPGRLSWRDHQQLLACTSPDNFVWYDVDRKMYQQAANVCRDCRFFSRSLDRVFRANGKSSVIFTLFSLLTSLFSSDSLVSRFLFDDFSSIFSNFENSTRTCLVLAGAREETHRQKIFFRSCSMLEDGEGEGEGEREERNMRKGEAEEPAW